MGVGDFGGMMNNPADSLTKQNQEEADKKLKELKKQIDRELKLKFSAAKKLQEYQEKLDKGLIEKNDKLEKKLKKKAAEESLAEDKKKADILAKYKRDKETELIEQQGKLLKAKLKGVFDAAKDYETELKQLGGGSVAKGYANKTLEYGLETVKNTLHNTADKLIGSVNDAITTFAQNQSKINARLYGSRGSEINIFSDINKTLEKNLAASPYLKYDDVLSSINTLVEAGVAYNVEQRAFLNTISDKIATTFNAANSTLLQIIRIQQEDSTAARLGMQASLTKFLNANFKDSTYMSSFYENITSTIADSVVQLGTAGGAEYEYAIQKWLGSLVSVGVGSSTINSLATALNQLGTGDVTSLSGTAMQNLIVMALNKVGVSYGDVLTGGLGAGGVDKLFQGILSVWQDIANTDNQVVRKQYSNLFGLSMSDLVAITNLADSDLLSTISKSNLSYEGAIGETVNQLGLVSSRMHVSELIKNAFDNAISGIGRWMANSPGLMTVWMVNDLIEQATGGINIPVAGVVGSFLDFKANVNQLAKLGMVGIGTLGQIGNIIASINNRGGLNLDAWGAEQYNRRGGGTQGVISGVSFDTSSTTYIGNASSSDIYETTLNAARDKAEESASIVNKDTEDDSKKLQKAIVEGIDPNIQKILTLLENVTNGALSFHTQAQSNIVG